MAIEIGCTHLKVAVSLPVAWPEHKFFGGLELPTYQFYGYRHNNVATLIGQKYFKNLKYTCTNCAINRLNIELYIRISKVCRVSINFGDIFL